MGFHTVMHCDFLLRDSITHGPCSKAEGTGGDAAPENHMEEKASKLRPTGKSAPSPNGRSMASMACRRQTRAALAPTIFSAAGCRYRPVQDAHDCGSRSPPAPPALSHPRSVRDPCGSSRYRPESIFHSEWP